MGHFLAKPNTEKHSAQGDGNGLHYGLSTMQGWRKTMEDAHTAVAVLPHEGLTDWSFFAVYDGHAGSRVANYCSDHMLDRILSGVRGGGSVQVVKDSVRSGFLEIDEHMRGLPEIQEQQQQQQQQGPDDKPQQEPEDRSSGCTAVGLLLSPDHLYFINCGDSRAVLCRDGKVRFSTKDHKPYDDEEYERIENAGGFVMNGRVKGDLAVSRALGDYGYKAVEDKLPTEQLVSPEPEVTAEERAEGGDEFVVLASDGIWDVMTNEDLCAFVRSRLQLGLDLEKICNSVVDTCLHKGSKDNMSVVLVCFPGAPEFSEEAKKKEEELDEVIQTRVEELMKVQSGGGDGVPDLMTVVTSLATENIRNLPPGGGLESKRDVIEATYNKLNPPKEPEEENESPEVNGEPEDTISTQTATK